MGDVDRGGRVWRVVDEGGTRSGEEIGGCSKGAV